MSEPLKYFGLNTYWHDFNSLCYLLSSQEYYFTITKQGFRNIQKN